MNIITLDFETYYDMKTFSLSKMTTEAYIKSPEFEVVGFAYRIDEGEIEWVTGSYSELKSKLTSLQIENKYLLCHNTAFDGAILSWIFGIKPKYYLDTLSMARPITGLTVGGSLKKLADFFMLGAKGDEVVNASGLRRSDFSSEQLAKYGEYCKNDVLLTYLLFKVLQPQVPPKELFIIDLMIRMYCDPVLELDRDLLYAYRLDVKQKRFDILDRLQRDGVGEEVLMSNQKFADLLRLYGVEPPTKRSPANGKQTYAMSKIDVEFKALTEHENPEVADLVRARLGIKSSIEESRTESLLVIADRGGVLPVPLLYYGAHTGRGSGWDKINLQNLQRGGVLRRAIRAPKGHVVIAVDSAQIEARMNGWLAGEDELVADFANGVDIYSKFASDVYGYPVDKSKKTERFVGKTCILGLGYGMGAAKFQLALKTGSTPVEMLPHEAKRVVDIYRNTYKKIVALWAQADMYLAAAVAGETATLGVGLQLTGDRSGIYLPNGLMIRYPNLRRIDVKDESTGQTRKQYVYDVVRGASKTQKFVYGAKVIENVVQALARNVVFEQMSKISQAMRAVDSPSARCAVVSTVHDEVIAVVPQAEVAHWQAFMEGAMSAAPKWAVGLPLACEGASGPTYGECK
jgi:DNA polymerase